jgi:uncharacterized repeat protein (TIGR01451 family)
VWSEQQKLVASDGASGDGFGISVSVSGDTVAVGACFDETAAGAYSGSAYVFVLSGAVWSEQQKLLASDGAPSDMFGCSVSLSGDTALVGAYGDDTAKGSAYVFVRSGTTWNEQQKLLASDGEEGGDAFGHSVSVSGDTTLVGARFDITPGGFAAGSAYAFARSGTIWSEEQKLLPWNLPADDLLGYSVSASGDTVVVGSPFDDTLGGSDAGSAYVFVRSGSGWSEEQKLLADDGAPGDRFGSAVSVSGDTLVIGAYNDDTAAGSDAGSAYVFVRSGTLWSEQQKLVASDGTAGDLFGRSVSVSGDTTVIGAPTDDTAAGVDAGSAYVFLRSGSVWSEQRKLVASDGAADDGFGVSVSISGDSAVAGSYLDDTAGGLDAGSAYVFVRSGTLWSEQQKLVAPDGATDDRFGYGVSISGDTAVVGAFLDDAAGGQDAGSAYVFERSGTAWSQPQKLLASDGAAHDDFGISVSVFGDTAVVGASYDDTAGGADSGSAYVFVRSGTVWSQQQRLLASDGAAGDLFGTSVSASGLWAVIGAIFDDTAGGTDAGSAYAFRASPISDLSVTITDGQATAVPGQPVTYTIVAMNAGPDPANDAAVWDALPESLTSAAWTCAGTGGGTCTASGSGSIYDGVTLPVGATVTYTLSATIAPAATGSLANTATVVYSPVVIDPDPSNNSATDADTLTPEADLELQKSDSPDPVKPGGVLAYALQVTNLGPSDSSGMTLTDALPPEVAFVSSTPGPPICTEAGGTVTCALPGLAPSTSQAVTVQATVSPGSLRVIVNTASVAGNETDPVSGNDTDTEPTTAGLFESELVHGTVLWADLAPAGGAPGEDLYRVGQRAYSSYEVAMDGTSGDIGVGQGPQLERLASDGSLLQSSVPAGAGGSRSLRWENDGAAFVGNEYVRVRSAGCTTTCGSEDVYRIRSWDTTLSGPRFNNSASQITILVLQNATPATVSGHARFWNGAGVLVGTQSFSMAAKGAFVVNTSVIPGLSGAGGTITLSHDGPYGTLVGKAVAVEPATGFTFDTPLTPRGRGIVR